MAFSQTFYKVRPIPVEKSEVEENGGGEEKVEAEEREKREGDELGLEREKGEKKVERYKGDSWVWKGRRK